MAEQTNPEDIKLRAREEVIVPCQPTEWMRGEGMRAHMKALYLGKKSVNDGIEDGLAAVDAIWPAMLSAAGTAPLSPERDGEMRERIAQLVDPDAFKSWQSLYDFCIKQGDDDVTATLYADGTWLASMGRARAKADAILSLLSHTEGKGS